ncbi:MAG: hypothetical protein P8X74_01620 [Reinekea sp.]|jgi:hypothetical protein
MKAIFAVSALAAAISTSAIAADTEWEVEFKGSMEAQSAWDFTDGIAKDVLLVSDDDEQEGWDLELDMSITNGPLSGGFYIDAGDEQGGEAVLNLDDIVVTEGKLSFGQVGSLMSTDDYLDIGSTSIGDIAVDNNSFDEAYGIDAGFKYEVVDGFTVQIQGAGQTKDVDHDNDPATPDISVNVPVYGAAAQYAGEAGALSYVVEGEFGGEDVYSKDGADPYIFAGTGVTYSSDVVTAMAYLNYSGKDSRALQYGVSLEATVAGATLSTLYIEPSAEVDDDEELELSVAYAATDAITVSAGYIYTMLSDAGDEVSAGLAWEQDAMAASADLTFSDFDAKTADPVLVELEVSYTSEMEVKYYTDFNYQPEEAKADVAEKIELIFGASYSF